MAPTGTRIGLPGAIAIVLGNVVGVAVFLTPPEVARHLPWNRWFLSAWALGAVPALVGALCMAELGAMLPRSGGDYAYIREAHGEPLAFLSGWTSTVITFPGSVAAMAVGLSAFQGAELFGPRILAPAFRAVVWGAGLQLSWAQVVALGIIVAFTALNQLGIAQVGRVQTALVALPVLGILIAGAAALIATPSEATLPAAVTTDGSPWKSLLPALVPVFFAYSGWNVITYVGDEIRDPARTIPRALAVGTLLAAGLYVLICWTLLQAVPAAAMPGLGSVPAYACSRLFGSWAGTLSTAVIGVAVLSSLNATILAGARVSRAMSLDGLAFSFLQRRGWRSRAPTRALWLQAGLSALLVVTGRFEQLLAYVVVVMLLSSSLSVAAVLVLRLRKPDIPRPYRVWGYPLTPTVYVLFCLLVVAFMILEERSRAEALWGMAITALGLPAFWWQRRASSGLEAAQGRPPGDCKRPCVARRYSYRISSTNRSMVSLWLLMVSALSSASAPHAAVTSRSTGVHSPLTTTAVSSHRSPSWLGATTTSPPPERARS